MTGNSFLQTMRNRHFLLIDVITLLLTPTLALMLRLDNFQIRRELWPGLVLFTLMALVIRIIIFQRFGLYARFWQYASVDELVQIATAVLFSSALIIIVMLIGLALSSLGFARSILVIDTLLVLLAVVCSRFSIRFLNQQSHIPSGHHRKVLIMGAGDAGEMIARELQKHPQQGLYPVAFLDDNPYKHGLQIHGLKVVGGRSELPRIVAEYNIDQIILAIPSAAGDVIREIVGICELIGVETKIVPTIHEIMGDRIRANQLRPVDIADLLRREPVQTDTQAVRHLVAGKRVLITGGGGSIGGELCRQLLYSGPSELIILGHGENSVFEIYHELKRIGLQGPKLTPLIADVRFASRIRTLFRQHRPDIVFHTAAHKHVPLMELNPAEAITNNVLGTRNVLQAAHEAEVKRFVMISTDKAVNPTSIMGASKRTAELLVHQMAEATGRPYVAVRFGNVLGSRGSVVLTFKEQIAQGGPVTITHPEITRYFMTIPEAVQLVLQAAVLGTGGEVFLLDMGEPVKIIDLAQDLIRLSGLEVDRDIELKTIGLRPGEKLFEELFAAGELYHRTPHQKIFIAGNASSFVPHDMDRAIAGLLNAAERNDSAAIRRGLQNLIPEYEPVQAATPKVNISTQSSATAVVNEPLPAQG